MQGFKTSPLHIKSFREVTKILKNVHAKISAKIKK